MKRALSASVVLAALLTAQAAAAADLSLAPLYKAAPTTAPVPYNWSGFYAGFNLGYHTFFGSLKFYPLFSPDGRLLTQAESEKLYGAAPVSLKPEAAE